MRPTTCSTSCRIKRGSRNELRPIIWAQKHRVDVDTFVIDIDHETCAGGVHPAQALRAYRDARGIPAKLVVVGVTSTGSALLIPTTPACSMSSVSTRRQPLIADFARA